MKTIEVKAKNGQSCPIPGQREKTATDKEYIEVYHTFDVRRLIREGSLEVNTRNAPAIKETVTKEQLTAMSFGELKALAKRLEIKTGSLSQEELINGILNQVSGEDK